MYEQKVKKVIIKHYKPSNKKFKTRGWEQCGIEIENFISSEQDKAKKLMELRKRIGMLPNEPNKDSFHNNHNANTGSGILVGSGKNKKKTRRKRRKRKPKTKRKRKRRTTKKRKRR